MINKVGMGYDIHCLKECRRLVLGGVPIPFDKGLEGHSDADVLIHALCDALLGALGQGDIGEHFPDHDETYRDISSLKLLEKVRILLDKQGYRIGNIDTMILAEKPKLQPYKNQMKANIAKTLNIAERWINIKATTQEGVGFALNGKEAICAYAIVSMQKGERE